jgi:uncharacterized lipoprotein
MPRPVLLLIAATLTLQACSLWRDKEPEYLSSQEGKPLHVPEDLDEVQSVRPIVINVPEMRLPSGDELNPGPPRAAATGGGDTNAYLAWSAAGVYLKVDDTPDSVGRRLGFVIERSGMHAVERSQEGMHHFEYSHPHSGERGFFSRLLFWRDDPGPDYSGVYRTRLEADGDQTRVYLLHDDGSRVDTDAAEHILGMFMERLG